ncbi:Hypothetical predicted protein [Mytilus galloprovincialis]|uniref:PiggyBac transposable element-derived protein domain-containing protein n=1 Tax=Mytilus galloprovincialis TaxID=29158 RepID=A0A8B6HFU0_MYTGA|nr:Hypothetical predicted protein [Mytilus galloprovincialis]
MEDENDCISSDEEDQLDFLLGEEFGEDDDAELYSPPNVDTLSSQDTCSSQSSQSISDPLERHIYWKDDNTEDNGNVDLRTTPFKPTRQPGFQTTNFTRRQLQHLKTPLHFLNLFMTVEFLTTLCIATNHQANYLINTGKYSSYTDNGVWEAVTTDELLRFFGIIIYMSVVKLSALEKYWSTNVLYDHCPVNDVMTKKRFQAILCFIQVTSPGDIDKDDKLTRIRYLLEHVKQKSKEFFHPHREISADERMVASKHKFSGIRQFIKEKPIRFGIKLWVLACSITGYTFDFFVYLGKKRTEILDKKKGLAYSVVMSLCRSIQGQGYKLFVDSFYTTQHLAEDLLRDKIYIIGAVRSNSSAMPSVFKQSKDWEKVVGRGDFRWHRNGSFVYVQWKDCKCVTLISPLHKGSDVTTCYRTIQSRKTWKKSITKQPLITSDYNAYMGGVDKSNQYLNKYTSYIRTQNHWWKVLFFHCLDIMIVNAYILFTDFVSKSPELFGDSEFSSSLGQLEFRENLAISLMKVKSFNCKPEPMLHLPLFLSKRAECLYCNAEAHMNKKKLPSRKVMSYCSVCKVPLCCSVGRNCFYVWHSDTTVKEYVSTNERLKKRKIEDIS